MDSVIFVVGLFSGIGVFLSTMYSLSRVVTFEARGKMANAAVFASIIAIMTALFFFQSVPMARVLAVPALLAALWSVWTEERWFKIFPLLVILFATVVLLGYVAAYPT